MPKEYEVHTLVKSLNQFVYSPSLAIDPLSPWDSIDVPNVKRTFVRAKTDSFGTLPYLAVGVLSSQYVILQPFSLFADGIKPKFNGTSTYISNQGEVIKRPEADSECYLPDKSVYFFLRELVNGLSV